MTFAKQMFIKLPFKFQLVGAALLVAVAVALHSSPEAKGQVLSTSSVPNDAQVEKAFQLRDRWSVWAASHKAALESVLQSDPTNLGALNTLVALLPPEPRRAEANISFSDLNPVSPDGAVPKTFWVWLPSVQMADDPKQSAAIQEQVSAFRKYAQSSWRQSFENKHDIVIAFSDKPDQKRISLWASGRITESNLVAAPGLLPQEGEARQLFPPYAFLLSTRSTQLLLSASEKERRLSQAKELRKQWEKWANVHKEVLQKLLQSQGKDPKALAAAWEALPGGYEAAGVRVDKFNGGSGNWTWNPAAKVVMYDDDPNDPMRDRKAQQVRDVKSYANELLTKNFAAKSDIALSSYNSNGPNITLWASGRITLDTLFQSADPGEPVLREADPQELVPPFEFLTP